MTAKWLSSTLLSALHYSYSSSLAVAISAAGLSNLAADPANHWRVLESNNMIKMLLRALVLDHPSAQHHILRLLCALVSNEATQAEVVSSGVVRAVQAMGNMDTHAPSVSLILFNISCNPLLSGRYAPTPLLLYAWPLLYGREYVARVVGVTSCPCRC